MKKKLFILVTVLIVIALIGYNYVYKNHRDIATEKASFSISVNEIYTAFKKNDSLANQKYSDKTIEVQGKITNIDSINMIVTLDDKLIARFINGKHQLLKLQNTITLKGRIIGYDDILDEIQIDQCTINE
jgi:hypothetical protein